MPRSSHLGARIRQQRNIAGLSQRDLAFRAKLDVSNAYIDEIEDGSRLPSPANTVALADALNARPFDFLALRAQDAGKVEIKTDDPQILWLVVREQCRALGAKVPRA